MKVLDVLISFFVGILFLQGRAAVADRLPLLTEDWTVRSWTVADGLPESSIRGIAFDAQGYMWLVTPRHLCRFDGVRFVDAPQFDLPGAPATPHLTGLLVDGAGRFWVYGTAGVWMHDGQRWRAMLSEADRKRQGTEVRQVVEGPGGAIWFVMPRALWRVENGRLASYPLPADCPASVNLHEIEPEGPQAGWLAASDRLLKFNAGKFEAVDLPELSQKTSYRFYHIRRGRDTGRLYSGSRKALYAMQGGKWTVVPSSPTSNEFQPYGIMMESGGNLWIASAGGLFVRRAEQWQRLFNEDVAFPLICHAITTDVDGNVWVGAAGGLVRLSPRLVRVAPVSAASRVLAIHAVDNDHILAGLINGGFAWGNDTALKSSYAIGAIRPVSALLQEPNGTVWAGTMGGGLYRCSTGQPWILLSWGGAVRRDRGVVVFALAEDRDGKLWAGTDDGLMVVPKADSEKPSYQPVSELPSTPVSALLLTSDGTLWIGSQYDGLACRAPDGRITRYGTNDGLPGPGVSAILRDDDGTLWLGGRNGLARWSGAQHTVFAAQFGLDVPVVQIVGDGQGRLWLGTPAGIDVLSRNELAEVAAGQRHRLTMRRLGVEEGMPAAECTGGFSFRGPTAPADRLWFATAKGVAHVKPGGLAKAGAPPQVRIESVRANGQSAWNAFGACVPGAMAPAGEVILPPGSRGIEVEFTGLHFGAPDRLWFQYRLESSGADWSRLANERVARFEWLPPGRHVFRVVAAAANGAWNEEGAAIVLVVQPWFWQTRWFVWLALVASVAMAAGLTRWWQRRRFLRRLERLTREQALQKERERIARDIHDDLGAGLTEVGMLGEWLRQDLAQALSADSAHRLDRLCESASELTRTVDEIVWAVNPANDTLKSFLAYAGQYAEQFLATAGLRYRLDLPEQIPDLVLSSAVRHHLFMILREALVNVVKHARASLVQFRVRVADGKLSLALEDNGCGFQSDTVDRVAQGHDGLASMRARSREIGGSLETQSEPGRGTCIEVRVKIGVS